MEGYHFSLISIHFKWVYELGVSNGEKHIHIGFTVHSSLAKLLLLLCRCAEVPRFTRVQGIFFSAKRMRFKRLENLNLMLQHSPYSIGRLGSKLSNSSFGSLFDQILSRSNIIGTVAHSQICHLRPIEKPEFG